MEDYFNTYIFGKTVGILEYFNFPTTVSLSFERQRDHWSF